MQSPVRPVPRFLPQSPPAGPCFGPAYPIPRALRSGYTSGAPLCGGWWQPCPSHVPQGISYGAGPVWGGLSHSECSFFSGRYTSRSAEPRLASTQASNLTPMGRNSKSPLRHPRRASAAERLRRNQADTRCRGRTNNHGNRPDCSGSFRRSTKHLLALS